MHIQNALRSVRASVAPLAALVMLTGSAESQAPPHDNCSGALPLPLGQTPGTNEGSSTSPGSVSCSVIGKDVWYTLVTPNDGLLTISTIAGGAAGGPADEGGTTPFDTVLTVYSGSCDALVPLACNDDVFPALQSEVQLIVSAGQALFVRVGGFFGDVGDFVLTVTLQDFQPVTNDECSGALPLVDGVTSGSTLGATTSAVPASCGLPSNDVWFSYVAGMTGLLMISTADGGEITEFPAVISVYEGSCGALSEVACSPVSVFQPELGAGVTEGQTYLIRLGGLSSGDFGDYVLALELGPGEPAPNDECSTAVLLTSNAVSGSNTLAFTATGSGDCTTASKNVWYAYAPTADGELTASLLHHGGSADFDTALAVYAGWCGSLQQVACNDDFDLSSGVLQSEATFPVSAGVLYFVSIGGYFGHSGNFTLSLLLEPENVVPFVNALNGHSYMPGSGPMTWSQARDAAESMGGHLATLGDPMEVLTLQLHFGTASPYWIGLTDEGHEGDFTWVTGEPFAFESWKPGQPDDDCNGAAENYVATILGFGEWFDTTDTGCTGGPMRGLIEVDGPTSFASTTSVGQGCATDTPPMLLGSLPVLGQTIALTVLDPGTLSSGVILGSAIPAAPTPLGNCVLQLDPASRFTVAAIATDAIGYASVSIAVPSDPALVGLGVALQAFLVRDADNSPAITNGLHVVLGH